MHKARTEMIEETRSKLIAAARDKFGRVGYAKTVMDELTADAGLTRGALYHHFGDKRGLFLAVLLTVDGEINTRLDAIEANESDIWQAFKARCLAYLAMSLEPEVQRIMYRDAASVLDYEILKTLELSCVQGIVKRLSTLMEQGIVQKNIPEVVALFINGGLYECAMWIVHSSSPEETYQLCVQGFENLLDGLKIAD